MSSSETNPSSANLFAVIMAGGPGSRLWPESRKLYPKPFLPLAPDGRLLISATFDRLNGLVPAANRFVVAGRPFARLVVDALPELRPDRALLEPEGRNTAACVAWSALEALAVDPDAILVTLPSDAWIDPDDAFRDALANAVELVRQNPNRLVTLGIKPTEPSSAFGYIKRGDRVPGQKRSFGVAEFKEKPDAVTARQYLETGEYLWNAGVFVWKASLILQMLRACVPAFATTLDTIAERIAAIAQYNMENPGKERRVDEDPEFVKAFRNAPNTSIDYAVLERAPTIAYLKRRIDDDAKAHIPIDKDHEFVVRLVDAHERAIDLAVLEKSPDDLEIAVVAADSFLWNDVGSFSALESLGAPSQIPVKLVEKHASGNYARVSSRPEGKKLVAVANVDNLLVVDSDDVLLIADKDADLGEYYDVANPPHAQQLPVELVEVNASGTIARVFCAPQYPGPKEKTVVALHCDDLLIVDAWYATLVTKKTNPGAISALVKELKSRGLDEYL